MAKPGSNRMRNRMLIVLLFFIFGGFLGLIIQLFKLQIVRGEELQQKAVSQQTRSITLGANRGTIYDRNNNILAQSATVWNVCISPAQIQDEQLPLIAETLSGIDVTQEKIYKEAADKDYYYKLIKRQIERDIYDEIAIFIDENDISGVFFEPDTKRYYPYGSLASTILGFTNFDKDGAYGLEAYYNSVLSGTPGMVVSAKDAQGSDMPFKYQQMFEPQHGNSVVLTIDEAIQHFLEKHLETAIVEHSIGNRAAGVVMNVKTGEILAMATKPDFDPNDPYTLQDPRAVAELELYALVYPEGTPEYAAKLLDLQYEQWRNKAISDPYEPGSVFKIITAATALDNNLVSVNDGFYCNGSHEVNGVTYHCWQRRGHGQQDFVKGMQNSCNPVFIIVGQRIGARLFHDYMDNFGLGEITGIDLPGEVGSIRQSFETLNKPGMIELSSTSFGQTFKVTPIQLITAVSASVNGGYLMQPYVVKQVLDVNGNVIETTQPVVKRQVISEETSAVVRDLVEAVVDGGSGRYAAIPGYRLGGKTGTSEKMDIAGDKNILSFVGFAPMEDPEYAILVMLDEPKLEDQFGSVIAAPVVGAVYQEMLPYVGLEAQYTQEELADTEVRVPDLRGEKPHDAMADLRGKGLQSRLMGNGASVLRQIPQAGSTMAKGGTVVLYTEEEEINTELVVPNVVGMSAIEANELLTGLGLNIDLRGEVTDGIPVIVEQQWPLAGAQAETGDIVIVTLVRKPEDTAEPVTDALGPEIEIDFSQLLGEENQEE